MSVAVRRGRRMRVAEFIEWAAPLPDEERWELLDGEPVLTAPQNERHQMIAANLLAAPRGPADRDGCRALPGLALLNEAIDDFAPIPDVAVRCGPVGSSGYAKDPVFVADVLSPSTMDNDRGRKTTFCKSLPSLATVLIVFQDEARVEVWRREDEAWSFRACRLGDTIEVPRPSVRLRLDRIFAGFNL